MLPSASTGILHETFLLRQLAAEKPGIAPRPLFVDHEGGRATQEIVFGHRGPRTLSPEALRLLVNLRRNKTLTTICTQSERLAEQVAVLPVDKKDIDLMLSVLDRSNDRHPLPVVWSHGDLVPPNMLVTSGKQQIFIDWESGSPDGFPLFDIVYFYMRGDMDFKGERLGGRHYWETARQYLEALEIDPSLHQQLFALGLVQIWANAAGKPAAQRQESYVRKLVGRLHRQSGRS